MYLLPQTLQTSDASLGMQFVKINSNFLSGSERLIFNIKLILIRLKLNHRSTFVVYNTSIRFYLKDQCFFEVQ